MTFPKDLISKLCPFLTSPCHCSSWPSSYRPVACFTPQAFVNLWHGGRLSGQWPPQQGASSPWT